MRSAPSASPLSRTGSPLQTAPRGQRLTCSPARHMRYADSVISVTKQAPITDAHCAERRAHACMQRMAMHENAHKQHVQQEHQRCKPAAHKALLHIKTTQQKQLLPQGARVRTRRMPMQAATSKSIRNKCSTGNSKSTHTDHVLLDGVSKHDNTVGGRAG